LTKFEVDNRYQGSPVLYPDLHAIVNYLEDRRIDGYIQRKTPGFVPYYEKLYAKYFTSQKALDATIRYAQRKPYTYQTYITGMLGALHPEFDVRTIDGLDKLMSIIELDKIYDGSKLSSTEDTLQLGLVVYYAIQNLIDKQKKEADNEVDAEETPEQEKEEDKEPTTEEEDNDNLDVPDKQEEKEKEEQKDYPVADELEEFIDDLINTLEQSGWDAKEGTSSDQRFYDVVNLLDSKEVDIKKDVLVHNWVPINKHETVVFSSSLAEKEDYRTWIAEGRRKGAKLSRMIKNRNNNAPLTFVRQSSGKIDNRVLHEIAYSGSGSVFRQDMALDNSPVTVNLALDVSGSMRGRKWEHTIKLIAAFMEMAKSVELVRLNVFVKTVLSLDQNPGPGGNIQRAAVYHLIDSARDTEIQMVKKLNSIAPNDSRTPEGVTIVEIAKIVSKMDNNGQNLFFNLTDGAPDGFYGNHILLMENVVRIHPSTLFVGIMVSNDMELYYPDKHVVRINSIDEIGNIANYVTRNLI